MNIMMDSHYSRLELPRHRTVTSESQGRNSDFQRMHASKCTEPLLKGDRLVAFISNTCIARSSYAFQLPEVPQGLQIKENKFFKCRAAKALFSKHKKKLENNKKQKRNSVSNSILPNGFSRILKAKSTVIKQNKLQEFYINLGDEEQAHNLVCSQSQNMKSNFFKPNFSKKKIKMKRQSLYVERSLRHADDYHYERANIGTKIDTNSSKVSQINQGVLKERVLVNNRQKATHQKRLHRNMGKMQSDKHKSKVEEKQNMEFNLEPWENPDDDPFF